MTPGRRRRVDNIPDGQPAIVGVNIRTLRQRKGWSQAKGARRINLWHPGGVVITSGGSRIRPSRCSSSRRGSRGGAGGGPPMSASPCRRS